MRAQNSSDLSGRSQPSFFFYDLETSGLSARRDRIMQFAGIRVDLDLNPLDQEVNLLIKMTDDILPAPAALMVTKITPQQTVADGITEAEFCQIFTKEISTPGTILVGYNNVRFDDEFIRHALWRNFRDPYQWSWADGRSRWDLLDVVRLTRALRPDGINWPTVDGKASNRLELLTKENHLPHLHAHDALSDVEATINVAKMLKTQQPKLFDYLFKMRAKTAVADLVGSGQPFIYASGRYSADFDKTTAAVFFSTTRSGGLVWDLRADPANFSALIENEILANLTADWATRTADGFKALPVKEICFNKCPAVAPLGTLDAAAAKRLKLDVKIVEKNWHALKHSRDLADKIAAAWNRRPAFKKSTDVDAQLYDSFAPDADKAKIRAVAAAEPDALADFHPDFTDARLPELLLRYKARNFPKTLSNVEAKQWESWRQQKVAASLPDFAKNWTWLKAIKDGQTLDLKSDKEKSQFASLKRRTPPAKIDDYVLEELKLWAESIAPDE
ncbi:MAG: exodeoxyribonuclease I [Candidatus Nomurabacteria bacterium]|jgi:exodeoxyribonuclease-1|nr:exodeoxyribonuclease I [Candidatus Nomurabacteria bacterium]